jgi:hypothetical protein
MRRSEAAMSDEHSVEHEEQADLSRRALVTSLLGTVAAGAALPALSACIAAVEGPEPSEDIGAAASALTGSNFRWADRYDIVAADSLRGMAGTNTPAGRNVTVVRGRSSVCDGGQGIFVWEHGVTTGDDGGTIIVPAFPNDTGRWLRIFDRNVNVKWFGARGDGVANDAGPIQAAINATPNGYGTCYVPGGTYRIERSLSIADDGSAFGKRQIRLLGSSARGGGFARTILLWTDLLGTNAPMLALYSSYCAIEGLYFDVVTGKRTIAAIDADKNPTGSSYWGSHTFRNLCIAPNSTASGTMDYGVRISHVATSNMENLIFDSCIFIAPARACVQIGNSFNAKHQVFRSCGFLQSPIGIEQLRGAFACYDCDFGAHGDAAIVLGNPLDAILIQNTQSEACHRFLRTIDTRFTMPVQIINGRFSMTSMAADGEYIRFTMGGPLTILGCSFEPDAGTSAFRIVLGDQSTASEGTTFVSIGNVFPNATPYALKYANSKVHFYSLGNMTYDAPANTVMIPDFIGRRLGTSASSANEGGGLRLGDSLSLSARTVDESAVLDARDGVVRADATAGPLVIGLPNAVAGTEGRLYVVKKVDPTANAVTLLPAPGDSIDGAAAQVLASPSSYVQLACDGLGTWMIVASG